MRLRFNTGVPGIAGLAAGGYALSQGEDPGSAALAGIGGALGGAAGLLGARALAGKYSSSLADALRTGKQSAVNSLTSASQNVFPPLKMEHSGVAASAQDAALMEKLNAVRAQRAAGSKRAAAYGGLAGALQGLEAPSAAAVETGLKYGAGALAAPGAAALAGLGGVALGAIPGAMGMPGFQQQAPMDPESYGSSNSMGARYKQPTMQYV